MVTMSAKELYRILWRWHFYAGLFALPFVIILSLSGAVYLFKPQIDAFNDAPFTNLALNAPAASADQQLAAALAAVPNATFNAYQLPQSSSEAIQILVNQGATTYRVYVHPQTLHILQVNNEHSGLLKIAHDIHGELLLGKTGTVLVELAASWAIVLVLTGMYLWWPRNTRGLAGVLYPRLSLKGRLWWKDVHSVVGIWSATLVLFLLISGLPWALVWGSAFKEVRTITGSLTQSQDWVLAGQHNEHAEHLSSHASAQVSSPISLENIVQSAAQLNFVYPVLIYPPSDGNLAKRKAVHWTVKSLAQNRPLRAEAEFNSQTGALVQKTVFSDRHIIDRIIGFGIAAHEGQLFGWFNQLLGLLVALSLIITCVSGFFMWHKRKPQNSLGAPTAVAELKLGYGFLAMISCAAVLLPLLGISLIILFIVEKTLLARWGRARRWLLGTS